VYRTTISAPQPSILSLAGLDPEVKKSKAHTRQIWLMVESASWQIWLGQRTNLAGTKQKKPHHFC
jgi:hypothetical protein